MARLVIAAGTLVLLVGLAAADAPKGTPLDPQGRPDEKLVNQPRRYYVWHDAEGWHLRSAAKNVVKFEGTIRAVGGTFRKCRPVGIDLKGKSADAWSLDKERRELRFLMHTSTSFDGFDFDLDGKATEVEFELSAGGKAQANLIFVGREGDHPSEPKFRLPADPAG